MHPAKIILSTFPLGCTILGQLQSVLNEPQYKEQCTDWVRMQNRRFGICELLVNLRLQNGGNNGIFVLPNSSLTPPVLTVYWFFCLCLAISSQVRCFPWAINTVWLCCCGFLALLNIPLQDISVRSAAAQAPSYYTRTSLLIVMRYKAL